MKNQENFFIIENDDYIVDFVGKVAYKRKTFTRFLELEKCRKQKILQEVTFLKTSFFEEYNDTLEKINDILDENDNFVKLHLVTKEDLISSKNFSENNLKSLQKMKSSFCIPENYINLDIKNETMKLLTDQKERNRASYEFEIFEKRNLLIIPRIAKFIVDVCKKRNIILGIGRGSSVASFVLYKIGLHRINPLIYDISFSEFLE